MVFSLSLSFSASNNNFTGIVSLPEGEHQYKFYVDGQWTLDPKKVNMMHRRTGNKSVNQTWYFCD